MKEINSHDLPLNLALFTDEEIRWTGNPNPNYEKIDTSIWGFINSISDFIEQIFLFSTAMITTVMILKEVLPYNNNIEIPIILAGFILPVIGWKYIERKKFQSIKYLLTNKRVIFRSWSLFKGYQINTIELKKVQKVSLEEYENEIGTIHFMGTDVGDYVNKSLTTGESKLYPTLEIIENAKDLLPKIELLIRESK